MRSPSENHVHRFVHNAGGAFRHRWAEHDLGGRLGAVVGGMGERTDAIDGNRRTAGE